MKTPEMTLENAIIFAAMRHAGQKDKVGAPYILHPLRVMNNLGHDATQNERIAALFHDLVEDDDKIHANDLRVLGVPEEVVQAILSVSKTPDEEDDYQKFIERCAQNPMGRKVKIADLKDNLDVSRLGEITPKDEERLEKYRRALAYLEAV